MEYWTFTEYKKTREKINPVSKWWGKSRKDKRPMLFSYIDNMVSFLVKKSNTVSDFDLGFEKL